MVIGQFGGSHKDVIGVQYSSGQLSVYAKGVTVMNCLLTDFTVSSPILYLHETDSFVTVSATTELKCYKYGALVTESETISQARDMPAEWSVCLGEPALKIVGMDHLCNYKKLDTNGNIVFNSEENMTNILVLTECSIFGISLSGTICFQKKLDFLPMTCAALPVLGSSSSEKGRAFLVTGSTGNVQLYSGMNLLWAARHSFSFIALSIAPIGDTGNCMVGLGDDGYLSMSYFGTELPADVVAPGKDIGNDFEKKCSEQLRRIREISVSNCEAQRYLPEALQIRAKVLTHVDNGTVHVNMEAKMESHTRYTGQRPESRCYETLTMHIVLTCTGVGTGDFLEDIQISISTPANVFCCQESLNIPILSCGVDNSTVIPISLYALQGERQLPENNAVYIIARYKVHGELRAVSCEVYVPLAVFCSLIPPAKTTGHKITLNTNHSPPLLSLLFGDMLQGFTDSEHINPVDNVLTFQYTNGARVNLILSKNAGRFRLQSSQLEAMWLILRELIHRLRKHFKKNKVAKENLEVSFQEALPLQDLFESLDQHCSAVSQYNILHRQFVYRSKQLRALQKRVLLRFKDKNPVSLSQLEILLDDTVAQISQAVHFSKTLSNDLKNTQSSLSAALQMLLMLMEFRFGIKFDGVRVLRSYISPSVQDIFEQCWEELAEASVAALIRIFLTGNKKAGNLDIGQSQPYDEVHDTSKLKKLISAACERLARGYVVPLVVERLGIPSLPESH